jgi:hypothetical protein
MQGSTIVSDAALCVSSLTAAYLARRQPLAVAGFASMAAAAFLGCLRYGPLPGLQPLHQQLSFLAAVVGMPLVLAGFIRLSPRTAVIASMALAAFTVLAWERAPVRILVATLCLLAWLVVLRTTQPARARRAIAAAIVASLVAAAFVQTGAGPHHIDGLHWSLAVAQLAFGVAFTARAASRLDPHIGKSPPAQVEQGEITCGSTTGAAPPSS